MPLKRLEFLRQATKAINGAKEARVRDPVKTFEKRPLSPNFGVRLKS
jgi:hypothetical protein